MSKAKELVEKYKVDESKEFSDGITSIADGLQSIGKSKEFKSNQSVKSLVKEIGKKMNELINIFQE